MFVRGVALRRVEESEASADHHLALRRVREPDARPDCEVVRFDVAGSRNAVLAREQLRSRRGVEVGPDVVVFHERCVDFIVQSDIQSQIALRAPFIANVEIALRGSQNGGAGREHIPHDGVGKPKQHRRHRVTGPSRVYCIPRPCRTEIPPAKCALTRRTCRLRCAPPANVRAEKNVMRPPLPVHVADDLVHVLVTDQRGGPGIAETHAIRRVDDRRRGLIRVAVVAAWDRLPHRVGQLGWHQGHIVLRVAIPDFQHLVRGQRACPGTNHVLSLHVIVSAEARGASADVRIERLGDCEEPTID